MLWHIVRRLRCVPLLSEVVVATSDKVGDEPIRGFCRENGIAVFAGSERDVLDRFYKAAVHFGGDPLIRVTGDCPFVDPDLVGRLLDSYGAGGYDHFAVATGAGAIFLAGGRFPDGLDAECLSFASLERAWCEATDPADREHVTPYIWRNKSLFRCGLMESETDFSQFRWTVDHEADFDFVSRVYSALYDENNTFLMKDILSYISKHPDVTAANRYFIGKEGYRKLWGPDK
jgi:spore coat polysaccharide biosynthesis protein SpsF